MICIFVRKLVKTVVAVLHMFQKCNDFISVHLFILKIIQVITIDMHLIAPFCQHFFQHVFCTI